MTRLEVVLSSRQLRRRKSSRGLREISNNTPNNLILESYIRTGGIYKPFFITVQAHLSVIKLSFEEAMDRKNCLTLLALASFLAVVSGHGMMFDPPMRSSMWRFGFNTPVNEQDNFLSCGYIGIQYDEVNQGRCGECGDVWSDPRPRANDEGGLYGTGTIGKTYNQGALIDVLINLNISHLGFFEFRLCPKSSAQELVTQECLDQNLLTFEDGTTRYQVTDNVVSSQYSMKVQLPADITCDNCVLQWYYRAANRIGDCGDGTSDFGCGVQETYVNCADVTINP